MAPTRWGIASAGGISTDFTIAIKSLPTEEHTIVAVAARSLDKAQEFASKFDIPQAYGSYEELAKNPDIEVVYLGMVNSEHHRIGLMMLNAGKHVVCEKPMCLNAADTKHLLEVAQQKKLFLAEAIWSRHFPLYKKLKEEIAAGTIGDIKLIDAKFGFSMLDRTRITTKDIGGGALYDVGIYPIQFAVMLLGRKPEKIVASGTLLESGVDECVCLNLHYSGGKIARLLCHAAANLDNSATIYGTKGNITIPFFWCPSSMSTPTENFEFPLPKVNYPVTYPRSEGLVYEVQGVRDSLLKGELEHPLIPAADSIAFSEIIDEALRQCGLE